MFHRAASLCVLALPLLAVASAVPRADPISQCNTGSLQCCNSVQSSTSSGLAGLLGLLSGLLGPITGQVGLTCSPITVIGASGNSCSAQPVCCSNNSFNGIIALGCSPININL